MINNLSPKEMRLEYWDTILREEEIDSDDISDLKSYCLPMTKESSGKDCVSVALLFSAIELYTAGSPATRAHLIAMLRYYFSRQGGKIRPKDFDPEEISPGVDGVVGLHLTWGEAMGSVGKGANNQMAFSRIKGKWRESSSAKWKELFDSPPPREFGLETG